MTTPLPDPAEPFAQGGTADRPPTPDRGRRRLAAALAVGAVAVLAAGGILLTTRGGGTPTAEPPISPTPTVSASPTASPAPSTPEQQAVQEAAAVVLKYEQMYYDLLAETDPYLNDLNTVLTEPQLGIDLKNLQQLRAAGNGSVESTGPVVLGPVEPLEVALDASPATVTLLVCVDNTAVTGTLDGKPWTGQRTEAQYRVEKTTYLPAPGWAVAQVLPPPGHDQPQPC